MALDGLVIHSLAHELTTKLVGGKIDRVHQPENDELVLYIRNNKENFKLVLSSSASNPRIYIANDYKKENPIKAPMFCMLFRKYIQGGIITEISQINFERIIKISVESFDELKEKTTKDIYIEIMGRHSNIILVQNSKIIDSIKRIPPSVSRVRQLLPNMTYELPPAQDKINPIKGTSIKSFINILREFDGPIYKGIYSKFLGISPSVAKEICHRANLNPNDNGNDKTRDELSVLYRIFSDLFTNIKKDEYNPCIVIDENVDKVIDFSCINLSYLDGNKFIKNDSISQIIEDYYKTKDFKERVHQRTADLRKSISIKLERLYHKQKKIEKELRDADNADEFKVKGELLTSYIYMIQKGMESVEVANFYDPNYSNIRIALNKNLTPSENAQKYFKKYNKLKTAKIELTSQIAICNEEIEYLENIMLGIENCENLEELNDIKDELIKLGYAKAPFRYKAKKDIDPTTKPNQFTSSDGFTILVGKNNKQNDYLTLRIADPEDLWMHTKNIPGSHVIIKCAGKEVPDNTLLEAATLAAYFSKARLSSQVPVDYTMKKHVKKPSGSKPGMVIYETNSTIYVTPTEELVVKLKNNK
ncbi:MAG: NFACT RNA binding domain-containing protein [Clostridiales bacterium]|uniref:Rqc2 family fibronectin-binding protein n=2 Tax=Terrisporobacter sp. TaxID=1965305 RepID=UPI002A56CECE|nr:NFACT RNA binding domain-containing protein [Terrisporobacter sp.]MDD7754739.1 NFACT RNA binding domain-containing protein [Clostridiales bacterium]MDY4135442.1 NFACT RNA binding domain-containing protein [Terrisporobacter sp.]